MSLVVGMAGCTTPPKPIPAASPAELSSTGCPQGTELMQGECVHRIAAPNSAMATEPSAPVQLGADPVPDSRVSRLRPRPRPLLVTEIQGLEKLFSVTPSASPDRPLLMRRIAEIYGELESSTSLELSEPPEGKNTVDAEKSRHVRDACRKRVVYYYNLILRDHPTYDKLDEVYYYLAVELALMGDSAGRRSALQALVEKYPGSRFATDAREAIGP
jgi:hypothetical protein